MYYVYILKDERTKEIYYGYTDNLERRIDGHQSNNYNWKLVYYEAYLAKPDARKREKALKQYGQSRTHLKNRIEHSLEL